MSDGDERESLRALGQKIEGAERAAQERRKSARREGGPATSSALALGWRIGLELVAAVVVATAIGWAADGWLGTRPWGTILMFFLGVAAGMVNVWRTIAGMGMAIGYRGGKTEETGAAEERDDED